MDKKIPIIKLIHKFGKEKYLKKGFTNIKNGEYLQAGTYRY